ncbi:Uncharacterised protein [Vibrio cholerae]|nr:Uncharacterised protein [Vibrio cholerae]
MLVCWASKPVLLTHSAGCIPNSYLKLATAKQ